MKYDTAKVNMDQAHDSSETSDNPTSVATSRKAWVQQYAGRMFKLWLRRQTCLGVTRHYMEKLQQDLAKWYDEPLTRMFIEATY